MHSGAYLFEVPWRREWSKSRVPRLPFTVTTRFFSSNVAPARNFTICDASIVFVATAFERGLSEGECAGGREGKNVARVFCGARRLAPSRYYGGALLERANSSAFFENLARATLLNPAKAGNTENGRIIGSAASRGRSREKESKVGRAKPRKQALARPDKRKSGAFFFSFIAQSPLNFPY